MSPDMVNARTNGNGSHKTKLGIGCVRVSTDRQERSIDEQKNAIRAASEKDGVPVVEDLWCEDEGVSGSILNRPGLSRLLALCRTRQDITDVYFWKRNRLTRSVDPLDGMNIEREIERHGKRIHFVQGIQKTGNKLLDFLASGLEYAEAGQYLVNLSTDTIRGLVPLTKQGFDAGRPTPYGYDRMVVDATGKELYRVRNLTKGVRQQIFPDGHIQTYENGAKPNKDDSMHSTLVLGDPQRLTVVKRIFEAYVRKDKGLRAIVNDLNVERIPAARGGLWITCAVRSILVNPIYTGANIWNVRNFSKYHAIVRGSAVSIEPDGKSLRFNARENWIVAEEGKGFPPIISQELFDLAEAKRLNNARPFSSGKSLAVPYYLTGLLGCSCGNYFQGHSKTSSKQKQQRKYFYYLCSGFAKYGDTVCGRRLVPKELIEQGVFGALVQRLRSLARVDAIRDQIKALLKDEGAPEVNAEGSIRKRVADLDARIRNWESAMERGVDFDRAVERVKALSKEKEAMERELALVRSRSAAGYDVERISQEMLSNLDRLEQVFREGAVAEAKAILRTYIGSIEYDPCANKARVGFYKVPGVVGQSGESRICSKSSPRYLPYTNRPPGAALETAARRGSRVRGSSRQGEPRGRRYAPGVPS